MYQICLLYTSDAADEEDSVDLGGSQIIKKKTKKKYKKNISHKERIHRNNKNTNRCANYSTNKV